MTPAPCAHEPEIVAAVLSRRWPEACDETLRAHAETCDVCREVVGIATLLKEDYEEAREAIAQRDVPLPSAGQIWWRAAVKARVEAAEAATRPLVWGYGVAAACAVALVIAGASVVWPSVVPVLDRGGAFLAEWMPAVPVLPAVSSATSAVMTAVKAQLPIVIGVAAFLVAVPVGLYFALREE